MSIMSALPVYDVTELPISSPRKVLVAIRAAQNVRRWGYYAAVRYCQKRGVSISVLEVALECEKGVRYRNSLSMFLVRQAW